VVFSAPGYAFDGLVVLSGLADSSGSVALFNAESTFASF
jgi:hypothetical protein